jgi:hypothetical protein
MFAIPTAKNFSMKPFRFGDTKVVLLALRPALKKTCDVTSVELQRSPIFWTENFTGTINTTET